MSSLASLGMTGKSTRGGKLHRELDALRLTARQRGRALAEMDISQPDVVHGLQLLPNPRLVLEKVQGVFDGKLQNVGDALATEADLERFPVVAFPLADLARDIDVRQKVHLDFYETIALTGLAASALHVE